MPIGEVSTKGSRESSFRSCEYDLSNLRSAYRFDLVTKESSDGYQNNADLGKRGAESGDPLFRTPHFFEWVPIAADFPPVSYPTDRNCISQQRR
jgi:hypothetical protein